MPSGRGIESARTAIDAVRQTASTSPAAAVWIRSSRFFSVGLIYSRSCMCNRLITKRNLWSGEFYVSRHPRAGVEDFDSRGCPGDVTYCPKSTFASREAPTCPIGPTPARRIPLAQRLLLLETSGATKTALGQQE